MEQVGKNGRMNRSNSLPSCLRRDRAAAAVLHSSRFSIPFPIHRSANSWSFPRRIGTGRRAEARRGLAEAGGGRVRRWRGDRAEAPGEVADSGGSSPAWSGRRERLERDRTAPSRKRKAASPLPAASSSPSTSGGPRSPPYTVEEDLVLVSAWLNVSMDPVASTGFPPMRTNEARMLEGDSSQRGAEDVEVIPRTQGPTDEVRAKSGRRHATSLASTRSESVLKEHFDNLNAQFIAIEGRREQLILEQEKGVGERHEQMLAIERERNEIMRQIEEKKLQLKEKELDLQNMREENMIMQLDLSKLDDDSKEYYRIMRKKLIAKACADV